MRTVNPTKLVDIFLIAFRAVSREFEGLSQVPLLLLKFFLIDFTSGVSPLQNI